MNTDGHSGIKPQASSAELHSAVSQICNLRMFGKYLAQLASERLPISNRRYSRVQLCATNLPSAQTSTVA